MAGVAATAKADAHTTTGGESSDFSLWQLKVLAYGVMLLGNAARREPMTEPSTPLGAAPENPARPRAFVLTSRDPSADPRVGWVAATLAARFDVTEIGLHRDNSMRRPPTLLDHGQIAGRRGFRLHPGRPTSPKCLMRPSEAMPAGLPWPALPTRLPEAIQVCISRGTSRGPR